MKRLFLFVPVALFVVLGIFLFSGIGKDPTELPSMALGKKMPAFELPELGADTRTVTEKQLLGRAAVLNVWASWCPTCVHEHPFLLKLSKRGIPVIGINYQDEDQAALNWLEKYKNPYELIIVDKKGRLGFDLGVTGAPETFLLDANGQIRYRHTGVLDEAVWQAHFASSFAGQSDAQVGQASAEP
ncbi:DsbE family thiol:disulfide interchange protein [Agaribacterium haliotis]|uniref:DsbE family thiol:disulfide interchange protein n=1 Tax=Agaribacterium haliotis TaxID=2013869 RepID=UPI000BB53BD1|nr:DsbE family thiol:disulfide interchange protein [Agaribacterium haliotis]